MEVLLFASMEEAERHLRQVGYCFQGAPGRWRKACGDRMSYANIRDRGNGAVVIVAGGDRPSPGSAS